MSTATLDAITPDTLLEALSWRYATKAFDPTRTIPEATWKALEASLVLTPSSYGLQPYRFLVVENSELRAQLRPESWGQSQITDASHLVVFLARKDMSATYVDQYLARIAEVRGQKVEDLAGFRTLLMANLVDGVKGAHIPEWAGRQAYIAFGQLMLSAALLGVDACPLEGLDAQAYDRILGLEDGEYRTVAACALGYRAESDKYAAVPKVRFPQESLVIHR